jgi:uncharacterized protein
MVDLNDPIFRHQEDGFYFWVKVKTRAHSDQVLGKEGEYLKVAITAAPTDGKANQHLLKFLGKFFKIAPSKIKILKGELSRVKLIWIKSL